MRQGLEGRRSRSEGMERQRNPEKPDGFRGSVNRAARNIRGGGGTESGASKSRRYR